MVFPGILGAALLAFSLSFDDFIVTNLNAGTTTTFPLYVWGVAQRGVPMQVNVVGTLMFVISIAIVLGGEARNRARTRALREPAAMDMPPPIDRPAVLTPHRFVCDLERRKPHETADESVWVAQSRVAALSRTTRRICSISSKCVWSQISGGDSWMTGSPRSSARQ